MESNQS